MAALPLCASWFPPSGVGVASHSARPASRVTHIHSRGRRGPSPLPIRIQARTRASHLRSPKAADRDHHGPEPQPKPERSDDEPDAAASTEIPFVDLIPSNPDDIPEIQELRKFRKAFCAAWLPREAPDMFRIEKDEISNYMRISSRANVQFDIVTAKSDSSGMEGKKAWSNGAEVRQTFLVAQKEFRSFIMVHKKKDDFLSSKSKQTIYTDVNNKVLALFVCAEAQEALDLASMVMDLTYIESLDRGTIQLFDQHTANQVIRMCVPIFCYIAKAAYLKRIEADTVLSFLDALRGLGVFCDMLFQQIVFKLKDGPLKSSISKTMGTHSRNFDKKMKSLKEQFIESTDATGIKHTAVMDTLSHGMKHAQSYILQMIPRWSLFA